MSLAPRPGSKLLSRTNGVEARNLETMRSARASAPDSRQHPRETIRLPVRFRVAGGGEELAECRDVSVGGMFVETERPAPFGAAVEVVLRLPDMKTDATLAATVRWVSREGMGVQFGMMGARETHGLTELIRGRR